MRILLTNDDGIHAPGIVSLHTAISDLGDVWSAAPLTVQSAAGHGITYTNPLMVEPVQVTPTFGGMAIDGKPADCVKLAIRSLWPEQFGEDSRPDLTISGMNAGANVGINILYSGTVAAAIESAFLGVPSIAVSLYLKDRDRIFWDRAAELARITINHILATRPLTPHEVLNVNIPPIESPDAPMPPIRVVGMNAAPLREGFERRISPAGQIYYWSSSEGMQFTATTAGSDVDLIRAGNITVTPLSYVMTDADRVQEWRESLEPITADHSA
ncbi:MAG: 5'/3'-nucleotidase SurE [Phycisphaerales bacterium]|jgi:5'-nucleotidase|nr:5'/3'-nucleotidase SurE [Phycisphaerales bacterium]